MSNVASTVGTISQVASIAGTAVSAYGTYSAGQQKKSAYEYNAQVATADAAAVRAKAAREEEISRARVSRLKGTQRAMFAAAGVDPNSGTPLGVIVDTVREGEKEAQYIRFGGETEATKKLNEARMNEMYGENAGKAGTANAMSQFATGLGKIATSWYTPK